jgi:hypothetical protein
MGERILPFTTAPIHYRWIVSEEPVVKQSVAGERYLWCLVLMVKGVRRFGQEAQRHL